MGRLSNIGPYVRTLRHLRLRQILARVDYRLRTLHYASPFYKPYDGPVPDADELLLTPAHLWPGDPAVGRAMAHNTFTFVGRTIALGKRMDWHPTGATALWAYHLHYFDWLRHLRALGTDGQDDARRLVEDWIDRHKHFQKVSWHPYPLSVRLISWLTHAGWLTKNAPDDFKQAFMASLTAQAAHLAHVLEWDVGGNHLIKNLKALIYVGLCLPGRQSDYLDALGLLLAELKVQILPDGGHYERSPHYHAEVLRDLLDIHALIRKAGHPPPVQLEDAIDRAGAALKFYRYPDFHLGLFNDGEVDEAEALNTLLKRCDDGNPPAAHLPDTGYVRLERGKAMLMLDAGPCCPDDLPAHAHADTLSFEMTVGRERVFVNSGTYAYQHPLRNTLRGTAAHNTVVVDGQNSAEVWDTFRLGRRPATVEAEVMVEKATGIGVVASHNGYRHVGVKHTRQVFMAEDGTDIRGEDKLVATRHRGRSHTVAAHFHLHPDIKYSMKAANEVILETPSKVRLSFRVHGGRLYDAESSYSPYFGEMIKTRQFVLRGKWGKGECVLKWAIKVL